MQHAPKQPRTKPQLPPPQGYYLLQGATGRPRQSDMLYLGLVSCGKNQGNPWWITFANLRKQGKTAPTWELFDKGWTVARRLPQRVVTGIQCPKCKERIWSRHTHDFRYCGCGEVAIDGGRDYVKAVFKTKPPKQVKMRVTLVYARKETK